MSGGSPPGPIAPLAPLARLLAVAQVVRPINLLAIGLSAWVGARLGQREIGASDILIPILIGAFGYARNDAVDLAADRFNRPRRPVPSGVIGTRTAAILSWGGLGAASCLLVAYPHGPLAWGIALLAAGALYAYSPWLKERGAPGPISIASLTSLAVLWGAAGGATPERAALPALLAGAAQFAREGVKQLEDEAGDRNAGSKTWAVRRGAQVVTRATKLALVAALLLLPLPASSGGLNAHYLLLALPTSGPLLLWALFALGSGTKYGAISAAIKGSLFFGLAAMAWGA
ncbi:MAG: UbiA family prenyltransferase [Candidatus Eisenbacteria bacterium]